MKNWIFLPFSNSIIDWTFTREVFSIIIFHFHYSSHLRFIWFKMTLLYSLKIARIKFVSYFFLCFLFWLFSCNLIFKYLHFSFQKFHIKHFLFFEWFWNDFLSFFQILLSFDFLPEKDEFFIYFNFTKTFSFVFFSFDLIWITI